MKILLLITVAGLLDVGEVVLGVAVVGEDETRDDCCKTVLLSASEGQRPMNYLSCCCSCCK